VRVRDLAAPRAQLARPGATATVALFGLAAATAAAAAAGCGGDNLTEPPAFEPADMLIVAAHFDDDEIFMQPELRAQLGSGSVTTVFVSTGDEARGVVHGGRTFVAARTAYGAISESSDWNCGYVRLAGSPVEHCRLRDRPVSLIALGTADGGVFGERADSPLHLMEGKVPDLPIIGPIPGRATVDSIVASLAELIAATQPVEIQALDLAATHGHDHSGHLFSSAFAFWAAAEVRYAGPVRWHRGYNVEPELVTLSDAEYAQVKPMLGYFDACYTRCGPCGTSCRTLAEDHDKWVQRQYSSTRSPLEARGQLAHDDRGACMSVSPAGTAVLADCAAAAAVRLDAAGHLAVGDACLASAPGNDDPVVLAPCQDTPAQYWVVDSDGLVWNGRPPEAVACTDGIPCMDFDHVRCLDAGTTPGAPLIAPICGSRRQPHWHFDLDATPGAR
jgi:hypothetical protein